MNKLIKAIPSMLTLGNLLFGFAAIAMAEHPFWALLLICAGALLDISDGLVARALNATSAFGKEADSLADLVTFGVAPAIYVYYQLLPQTPLYIAIVALIPLFAAIRLAKFNNDETQHTSFKGLPSPAAGLFFAGIPAFSAEFLPDFFNSPVLIGTIILISVLMVIPLPMFSFKAIRKGGGDTIFPVLLLIGAAILIIWLKWTSISVIVLWYILLSVLYALTKPKNQSPA